VTITLSDLTLLYVAASTGHIVLSSFCFIVLGYNQELILSNLNRIQYWLSSLFVQY
jgi:hypothetical protein